MSNLEIPNVNPKAAQGSKKTPIHLVPSALILGTAEALEDGNEKYGYFNYRESPIAASVYVSAMGRHMLEYFDGEDLASDSGIMHLKHVAANIAILLDATATGNLVDDRPAKGAASKLIQEYTAKKERKLEEQNA